LVRGVEDKRARGFGNRLCLPYIYARRVNGKTRGVFTRYYWDVGQIGTLITGLIIPFNASEGC